MGAAWSLFESQWLQFNHRDVRIDGLPGELDGFRILHLSDLHLGTVSFNGRVVERAVAWASHQEFDLVAVTGDLLSRRRGEPALRRVLPALRAAHGIFAVLGNHDIAETRDPLADARPVTDSELAATLLVDSSESFDVRGHRVQVAGADPHAFVHARRRLHELADADATLRILLCHFPEVVRRLPAGFFHLVLAGHLHGGQICLPAPWGKVRLQHPRAPYWEGLHRTRAGMLHVSRGLGTAFVPFRFLARPEVTALTLRTPPARGDEPPRRGK
jgi:predicted MPP superfamily phosphohydrolase